jgi:hypothetical protein
MALCQQLDATCQLHLPLYPDGAAPFMYVSSGIWSVGVERGYLAMLAGKSKPVCQSISAVNLDFWRIISGKESHTATASRT